MTMTIQNWSDDIIVAELTDDPQFTEELATLAETVAGRPVNVVVNLAGLTYLNSSNISRLLRLRKMMLTADRRLILAAINNQVWGVFIVTGLDKIFEFTNDVSTALAMVQLSAGRKGAKPE